LKVIPIQFTISTSIILCKYIHDSRESSLAFFSIHADDDDDALTLWVERLVSEQREDVAN
jgi:hypothetical protein